MYKSPIARGVAAMAAIATLGLGACTTSQSQDSAGRLLVGRGQYVFYDCGQLATQVEGRLARQRELLTLIARAKQGPGGGLVSALSYEPDLAVVRGELTELRREQTEKKCPAQVPARRTITL